MPKSERASECGILRYKVVAAPSVARATNIQQIDTHGLNYANRRALEHFEAEAS